MSVGHTHRGVCTKVHTRKEPVLGDCQGLRKYEKVEKSFIILLDNKPLWASVVISGSVMANWKTTGDKR